MDQPSKREHQFVGRIGFFSPCASDTFVSRQSPINGNLFSEDEAADREKIAKLTELLSVLG
jgi:hypothetical protein